MRGIAVIPARIGSVRVPKKNLRRFHGKPIMAYSIHAAQDSGLFGTIIVSTDDLEISDIALKCGAEVFIRSKDDGTRGTQDVTAEVLRTIDSDGAMACCIYATAPMLTGKAICEAFDLWREVNAPYVVPVGHWLSDPGQFYLGWAEAFMQGIPLANAQLFPIDPRTAIDINTMDDFADAERMYTELHKGET